MDWIEQSKEVMPETYALIKNLDYLIRETGECPTSNRDWVRLESMEDELLRVHIKLKRILGETKFNELVTQLDAQIELDVIAQINSDGSFLEYLTRDMVYLMRELGDNPQQQHSFAELREMRIKMTDKYFGLHQYMHMDRVDKVRQYINQKAKEVVTSPEEP